MSASRRARGLWLSALVVTAMGALLVPTTLAAFTDQVTASGSWSTGNWRTSPETFSHTGETQHFAVPEDATSLTIEVLGAQGGSASEGGAFPGGQGGRAKATIPVAELRELAGSQDLELEILVGGAPGLCGAVTAPCSHQGPGAGGASGGGEAGAGGGASAVLVGDQLLLAAGGGGGASGTHGGDGGGSGGENGDDAGGRWGTGGDWTGDLNDGRSGQDANPGNPTGGGGGGGGAGPGEGGQRNHGGGGGSGWIHNDLNGELTAGVSSGHGEVRIAW